MRVLRLRGTDEGVCDGPERSVPLTDHRETQGWMTGTRGKQQNRPHVA